LAENNRSKEISLEKEEEEEEDTGDWEESRTAEESYDFQAPLALLDSSEEIERKESLTSIIDELKDRVEDTKHKYLIQELKISIEHLETAFSRMETSTEALFRAYRAFENILSYSISRRYNVDLEILEKLSWRSKQVLLLNKIGSLLEYDSKDFDKIREHRNFVIHGFGASHEILTSFTDTIVEIRTVIEIICALVPIVDQTNPVG